MILDYSDFINEAKKPDLDDIETASNTERKEALEKWLQDLNYRDYVDTLNDMLKDPKAKTLLQDGFGGELGDIKLKFQGKTLAVSRLMPTQNEIDLDKSLLYGLKNADCIKMYFTPGGVMIKTPVITFNDMYVIDGHHRWSQILCFNPDAKVICANYDGNISPIQMLKATQGAIAADPSVKDIPVEKVQGMNIYDCNENKIRKYIEKNIEDDVVDELCNYVEDIKDKETAIDYLVDNTLNLINNHPLMNDAPKRDVMPQTDKSHDALLRMKKDKVLKVD